MESLRIDILNPKARKLLEGLADLKLIHISDHPSSKKKEADRAKVAKTQAGKQRREALEKLAEMGGIKSIPDPMAWQREQRKDRK